MKSAPSIAPPPPVRRNKPVPVEPLVFAVLLMAFTLGINVVLPKVEADAAEGTAHKAQPAQQAQVALTSRVN